MPLGVRAQGFKHSCALQRKNTYLLCPVGQSLTSYRAATHILYRRTTLTPYQVSHFQTLPGQPHKLQVSYLYTLQFSYSLLSLYRASTLTPYRAATRSPYREATCSPYRAAISSSPYRADTQITGQLLLHLAGQPPPVLTREPLLHCARRTRPQFKGKPLPLPELIGRKP